MQPIRRESDERKTKPLCKTCAYFVYYYGGNDKKGKPKVTNHRCVKRNGKIKHFPKQCEEYKEKML